MDNDQNNYTNGHSDDAETNSPQIFMEVKSRNRGFAVASLVLGILSILCCCITYAGLAMGIIALVFALVSKRKMGYFDPLAVAGLILGIIGIVFGVTVLALDILAHIGAFDALLAEWEKIFEEAYGVPPTGEI